MVFNIDHVVSIFDDDKKKKVIDRINEVKNEQLKLNMTPRSDSQLTFNYGIGKTNLSPKQIAHELYLVNFIFENTNYSTLLEEVMREVSLYFRFRYALSWNETWDLTKFYVPTMLKLYCLKKQNLKLPDL